MVNEVPLLTADKIFVKWINSQYDTSLPLVNFRRVHCSCYRKLNLLSYPLQWPSYIVVLPIPLQWPSYIVVLPIPLQWPSYIVGPPSVLYSIYIVEIVLLLNIAEILLAGR
jgi:hypothetical protein